MTWSFVAEWLTRSVIAAGCVGLGVLLGMRLNVQRQVDAALRRETRFRHLTAAESARFRYLTAAGSARPVDPALLQRARERAERLSGDPKWRDAASGPDSVSDAAQSHSAAIPVDPRLTWQGRANRLRPPGFPDVRDSGS